MTKRGAWIGIVLLACGTEAAAPHVVAQPGEPRQREDPRLAFHFPQSAPDAGRVTMVDGHAVIDGATTDVASEVPVAAHPIDAGHDLLMPTWPLAVWDRAARRVTRLPEELQAQELVGVGWVFVRYGYRTGRIAPNDVGDLDPASLAYRPLYSGGEVTPLGLYRGGLLVSDGDALAIARTARAPEVLPAALEGRRVLPDPLRGDRLLAARFDPTRRSGIGGLHADPPLAVVSVLDLARGRWRELGSVEGCVWTVHMGCCNEASGLALRWASVIPAGARPSSERRQACAHVIAEADERLHALDTPPPG